MQQGWIAATSMLRLPHRNHGNLTAHSGLHIEAVLQRCPRGEAALEKLAIESRTPQLHRGDNTFRGHQFVIDVVIRRNPVTFDHRQSQMDEPRTVGIDFMRDGSDKG
jgi:hypothetical protein